MTIKMKREAIDRFIWSIFAFFIIFAPPIVPYPHLWLSVFSMCLLLTTYKTTCKRVMLESGIYQWMLGMIAIAVYVCVIPMTVSFFLQDIVNTSHYVSLFNRFAVLVVTIIPCCTVFLCNIKRKNYDYHYFIEIIINAGLIEGVCAIASFISPDIKSLFLFFMRHFSYSGLYDNNWYITVRSYGFAGTLVDLFGLGIAIIAGIAFFYGVTEKRKYIFYSVIIAVATLLNARTGVIIYALSIVFSLAYLGASKSIMKFAQVIFAVVVISLLAVVVIKAISQNENTFAWISSGYQSFIQLFTTQSVSGDSGDALALLFRPHYWVLPDAIRTIIGTGHSLYGAEGYAHSDVGYINDIWFAGIVGCFVLYGMIVKRGVNLFRKSKVMLFRFSGSFILIAFFVFNIKGAAIGYNPGAAALFTIFFGLTYFNHKTIE